MWAWLASALSSIGSAAAEFGGGFLEGGKAALTGAATSKMGTFGTIGQVVGARKASKIAPKFQALSSLADLTGLGGSKQAQPGANEAYIDPKTGQKKRGLFTPLF